MEFLGTVIKPDGKSTNGDHGNDESPNNEDSVSTSDISTELTKENEAQPDDKDQLERYTCTVEPPLYNGHLGGKMF